ncbi:hypothetical protein VNO78_19911 [Psophocarpus tetragonolobus]|uniref:Uncharacterized protein n=1 Tax=Psophocarpus tetragonolobus TaxID=3891 RepID=A0AAN9XGP6_PSOTE
MQAFVLGELVKQDLIALFALENSLFIGHWRRNLKIIKNSSRAYTWTNRYLLLDRFCSPLQCCDANANASASEGFTFIHFTLQFHYNSETLFVPLPSTVSFHYLSLN